MVGATMAITAWCICIRSYWVERRSDAWVAKNERDGSSREEVENGEGTIVEMKNYVGR